MREEEYCKLESQESQCRQLRDQVTRGNWMSIGSQQIALFPSCRLFANGSCKLIKTCMGPDLLAPTSRGT